LWITAAAGKTESVPVRSFARYFGQGLKKTKGFTTSFP
jgi:hypothetical protein